MISGQIRLSTRSVKKSASCLMEARCILDAQKGCVTCLLPCSLKVFDSDVNHEGSVAVDFRAFKDDQILLHLLPWTKVQVETSE